MIGFLLAVAAVLKASVHEPPHEHVQKDLRQKEPNPPKWPSSVRVFSPTDTDVDEVVQAAFKLNGGHCSASNTTLACPPGQWSTHRFAFLFLPGHYAADVPVGFYTEVAGLGRSPNDVVFTGEFGVYHEEGGFNFTMGALDDFWRSASNFYTQATGNWMGKQGMLWAVSQASPLRRIHVEHDLTLYEYEPPAVFAGYASGGFIADSVVHGKVWAGGQQQWLTRTSSLGGWDGVVWNGVFVGTQGAPDTHCNEYWSPNMDPYQNVAKTPTITVGKPYIVADAAGSKFELVVPAPRPAGAVGPVANWTSPADVVLDFSEVYVADNHTDTATTINAKLAAGLHVVLSPGIYALQSPLHLSHPNQVLLGLGLATLVAANGQPCITVGAVDGVRVAGLLLQAGPKPTQTLLQWGASGHEGDASNPGVLSDVYTRTGGPEQDVTKQAEVAVTIDSGNVLLDNVWLWRADHTATGSVGHSHNPSLNGLVVNGDNVTAYGLAVEHHLHDATVWNGEGGQVYFYQCELPYDVTQANFGDKGYTGYRVAPNVKRHVGVGIGVYHYMRDHPVVVESGVVVPKPLEKNLFTVLGVFLNGLGTVKHAINDIGPLTSPTSPGGGGGAVYYCVGEAPVPPPHPSPPPGPAPPPAPPPAPAGWENNECNISNPLAFEKKDAELVGKQVGFTPGLKACQDCYPRCFSMGIFPGCIGFVHNGTGCAFYGAITGTKKAKAAATISMVLQGHVPKGTPE